MGLGVAGVAAGAVLGNMAMTEKKTLDAHCNADHRCDKTGLTAASQLQTFGNASTVAFAAGGAVLAAGTTLVVMGYRRPASSASANLRIQIQPGQTFLGIDGAF